MRFFYFQSVGCDLDLFSGSKYDRCGVCKGDGTGCELHKGSNYSPLSSPGESNILFSNNLAQKILLERK